MKKSDNFAAINWVCSNDVQWCVCVSCAKKVKMEKRDTCGTFCLQNAHCQLILSERWSVV